MNPASLTLTLAGDVRKNWLGKKEGVLGGRNRKSQTQGSGFASLECCVWMMEARAGWEGRADRWGMWRPKRD